jgi:hypothetical protein
MATGPSGQVGEPQGTLLAVLVWEDGKSECRAVMVRIGVGISPHVKAGRLPSGLPSQDGWLTLENLAHLGPQGPGA